MKKNTLITILSLGLMASLFFGIFQKIRADRQEEIASMNTKITQEAIIKSELHCDSLKMELEVERKIAEANMVVIQKLRLEIEKLRTQKKHNS